MSGCLVLASVLGAALVAHEARRANVIRKLQELRLKLPGELRAQLDDRLAARVTR